jgi:class 3 adenylate cyclase
LPSLRHNSHNGRLVSQVVDALENARFATERQAWRQAYAGYSGLDPSELSPSDLESFGTAAWWSGRIDEAIALREKAFAAFTSSGDPLGAARIAILLWWDYEGRGAISVANGWLATAERLLAGAPESVEHARLGTVQGVMAMYIEGDLAKAVDIFERTYELAHRVGDRESELLTLAGKGRALIKAGDAERGLALMDEASAGAMGGNLESTAKGNIYCMTISACADLGEYRRAAEWTETATRWCNELDVTGFPGKCRVHRAEVLRLRGEWPAAEAQAIAACEEIEDFDRSVSADAQYEVGEIRRQRGDFKGAEEAYRTANELGRDPQPGLALLRLAEGKVDAAAAGIARALADSSQPLVRLRRLPAQVEIALASGDLKIARDALAELEQIVDSYKIGARRALAFDATIHVARGRIELADKDWASAVASLQRGRDAWKEVGAPYETAQTRMLLALAYRRSGDEHAAVAELEGALAVFERLGAQPDISRVKELTGRLELRRTFVFTDIVGSTKLLETLGDDKWRRLLSRHDELLQEKISESGGEVVKNTGDGFFATFETPKAAIDAAIAIQRTLDAEVFAPDVRIGAHAADAFRAGDETTDYGGQGVHVAARVGALGGAGEIVVSLETLEGIESSFRLSEPRTESLKGIAEPVEVVSVDWR